MEQFSIGRVFARAFALIRDSLGSVGLFVLLLLVIETAMSLAVQPLMLGKLQAAVDAPAGTGPGSNPALAMFQSAWYWLVLLTGIVVSGLSWSGGVHGLLQQADKGSATLPECFEHGVARFLPVLGLTILWWLGVMLGWIALIVPATILISMWAVALPAMVGEELGVFEAFGRSRALTRGHRLSIFGVLFLLVIVYYLLAIVIAGSMLGAGALTGAVSLEDIGNISPWMTLLSLPVAWVSGMLLKSVVTSLYLETVLVKEGARTGRLTDVFE
jgi:hypothetical protein